MKFISRDALGTWLDGLAKERDVVAPCDVKGVELYRRVDNSEAIHWEYTRPSMSIKEFFFPSTEHLLTIEINGQTVNLLEQKPDNETLIFGARPCDARGVLALDAMFLDAEPMDTYYAARRKQTTIIGVACQEMGETCFCTSVGGSPNDGSGSDVLLTEVEGGFTVEALSDKGRALIKDMLLEETTGKKPLLAEGETVSIPEEAQWVAQFESPFWAELSERCISCRICAYVCPTCRCFDLRDEALPPTNGQAQYERIRCWDSCTGEAYRRIAGGHNPREAKADRLRNRFFCKFNYYPTQYGPTACTGCGRCIDACPVSIDIVEVLNHLAEVEV